jgi:hypothetical protein
MPSLVSEMSGRESAVRSRKDELPLGGFLLLCLRGGISNPGLPGAAAESDIVGRDPKGCDVSSSSARKASRAFCRLSMSPKDRADHRRLRSRMGAECSSGPRRPETAPAWPFAAAGNPLPFP